MTEVLVRAEGLDVNEVPDGYIIYKTEGDRVHYLKRQRLSSSSFVTARAAQTIRRAGEQDVRGGGTAHGEIEACVQSLLKEGLVLSRSK